MNKKWLIPIIAFMMVFAAAAIGYTAEGKKVAGDIILTPDEIQWKAGPSAIPDSKVAVLEGDPTKRGFFVMRLKLPAGAKIPAHSHMKRERVTVISGKFNLAMGEKPESPRVLPAGSYFTLSPKTVHNAWVDEETVVQVGTMGPWSFKPAKKEAEKK